MNAAVLHHYRHFRKHQLATWDRRDNSGGGAWPSEGDAGEAGTPTPSADGLVDGVVFGVGVATWV